MGIGFGFGLGPLRFYIPLTKRRRRGKYWTHSGCTIHHTSEDTANRCTIGRKPAPAPAPIIEPAPRPAPKLAPAPAYVSQLVALPPKDDGDLLIAAAELIVSTQSGSITTLMRKLRIEYMKASAAMDALESCGIVGPRNGSSRRDVFTKQLVVAINQLRTININAPL